MEENLSFLDTLETALKNKQEELDTVDLPQLKEHFRVYHSSYQGLYNILLRKSLIQEDPYKGEHKISDVEAPSAGPVMESEKNLVLSQRLSLFDSQLEFLNNYYQFSTAFLNLARLKRIAALTGFIKWSALGGLSSNINTRLMAELVGKMNQEADPMAHDIITDAANQLEKLTSQIMGILKKVSDYHRENYKFEVRSKVLPQLNIEPEAFSNQKETVLKAVKQKFPLILGDTPFYPELIQEIILETAGENGSERRNEVLKKLETKQKVTVEKTEISYRNLIFEAFRILTSAAAPLNQCIRKFELNFNILNERPLSFKERFKRWLLNIGQKNEKKQIIEIDFLDPKTSVTKTIKLNYTDFSAELKKKARLLTVMSNKKSNTYRNLEELSDEKAYSFLDTTLRDLQSLLQKLPSLDTYFKSEAPREQKNAIRGVKIETNIIKNAVQKANQKKHEYVARMEEKEQLKRLGIDMN